ncbi:MAG: NADH-quinone oxidoreductase subunit L, partial [Nitrospira sp.]|nr:NADH-quinone oxidoreductase subunit L [Nitrospira sp.]
MTLVLLVPAFLLVAAAIVLIGSEHTHHVRARLAAYPVGLACLGAVGTLYHVANGDPISIRFYDLSSAASFAIPIGFYVDRLSAVMMVLITGVSVIIYTYSTGYMFQDRHARRYLTLICLTDFVLICMVSSS